MLASFIRATAFVLAGVLGPGLGLQRVLRLRPDPSLVLPIGWAFAAAAYWTSLALGQAWLFPALVLALDLVLVFAWRGRSPVAVGPRLRGAVAPLAAALMLLALTQYGWNRSGPQGEFILDPLVPYDTGFHVGLTRELTIDYPPQVPGLSGFPIGYHLGADLVRAAALRWARVDPYDSITRLDPTLGALALILLLRTVGARLGFGPRAITLLPWTLFATDFSFLLAWNNASAHWWTDMLRGNLLISLCLANPIVPALALALGALVALSRHLEGEGRGWLVVAAGLALAVPTFKVFLGAHLLLGLGAAILVASGSTRPTLVVAALPAALATAVLALGQGGRSIEVALAPLDLVRTTRASLQLPALGGPALAAWAMLWVGASLGLRLLGLRSALRALLSRGPLAVSLSAMALLAWPLGLLLRVSAPEALAGQKVINDAAFLIEQGGPLLWIFTVPVIAALAERFGPPLPLMAASLLSLPSTVQFVVQKKLWPNDALPAAMVRAVKAVEAKSHPGDVVLQRPGGRFPPAPVLLASLRVPYERFTPWLTQFASVAALEARHELVYRFFRTKDRDEAIGVARALNARFLCLYEADRVRFDTEGLLDPVHEEAQARCYTLKLEP